MNYKIPHLPLKIELETKPVLKKLAKAHSALAELKGVTAIIPNQNILINTLSLQEAKDSSGPFGAFFCAAILKKENFVELLSLKYHLNYPL